MLSMKVRKLYRFARCVKEKKKKRRKERKYSLISLFSQFKFIKTLSNFSMKNNHERKFFNGLMAHAVNWDTARAQILFKISLRREEKRAVNCHISQRRNGYTRPSNRTRWYKFDTRNIVTCLCIVCRVEKLLENVRLQIKPSLYIVKQETIYETRTQLEQKHRRLNITFHLELSLYQSNMQLIKWTTFLYNAV